MDIVIHPFAASGPLPWGKVDPLSRDSIDVSIDDFCENPPLPDPTTVHTFVPPAPQPMDNSVEAATA